MKIILAGVKNLSSTLYWIAGIALISTILLTVSDIVLRRFGHPIEFTYEVVIFLGLIVVGFSLPQTSIDRSHVVMDFLTIHLPPSWQRVFRLATRIFGIALFIMVGLNLISIGSRLHLAGQVSPILEIPEFIFPYCLSACCFLESLVLLFYDFLGDLKGAKT